MTKLTSAAGQFEIQSRMERAVQADGSLSEATIFTAFAIQGANAWMQVSIH